MRITPQHRQRLNQERILALRQSLQFERRLVRLRTNEIKRVLKLGEQLPLDRWANELPDMLTEDYLRAFYENLYTDIGTPIAREAVNNFIGRKADMWEDVVRDWIMKNGGAKITAVNSSLKTWLRNQIAETLDDLTVPIEKMNNALFNSVASEWDNVKLWQTRRIVQTETLTASSVAGFESVRSLGIEFNKVWVSSGLPNTRLSHAEADGQEVGGEEPFIVDGELMMYPHDPSASAANVINCACSHIAVPRAF